LPPGPSASSDHSRPNQSAQRPSGESGNRWFLQLHRLAPVEGETLKCMKLRRGMEMLKHLGGRREIRESCFQEFGTPSRKPVLRLAFY
jgi:hypothetical protein